MDVHNLHFTALNKTQLWYDLVSFALKGAHNEAHNYIALIR